jgi:hypothetical protein
MSQLSATGAAYCYAKTNPRSRTLVAGPSALTPSFRIAEWPCVTHCTRTPSTWYLENGSIVQFASGYYPEDFERLSAATFDYIAPTSHLPQATLDFLHDRERHPQPLAAVEAKRDALAAWLEQERRRRADRDTVAAICEFSKKWDSWGVHKNRTYSAPDARQSAQDFIAERNKQDVGWWVSTVEKCETAAEKAAVVRKWLSRDYRLNPGTPTEVCSRCGATTAEHAKVQPYDPDERGDFAFRLVCPDGLFQSRKDADAEKQRKAATQPAITFTNDWVDKHHAMYGSAAVKR